MAELKTKETAASVDAYVDAIEDDGRRADCRRLIDLLRRATGEEPKMWGTSIVGFGRYHYKYASGHEGDSCLTGFASRKKDLTIYVMGLAEHPQLVAKLGKHKAGKGCLYLKRLADVDEAVLVELVQRSVAALKARG